MTSRKVGHHEPVPSSRYRVLRDLASTSATVARRPRLVAEDLAVSSALHTDSGARHEHHRAQRAAWLSSRDPAGVLVPHRGLFAPTRPGTHAGPSTHKAKETDTNGFHTQNRR